MAKSNVTVIGAGVVGLTTAYLLSQDSKYSVTVVAKYAPGDYFAEYASMWAGANYTPMAEEGTLQAQFEKDTFPVLSNLAKNHPDAGIHYQDSITYANKKENDKDGLPWWKDVVHNFRKLRPDELRGGCDTGYHYTSVCINVPVYLAWLMSKCLLNGIVFKRADLGHVTEAASFHQSGKPADLIVNCTGLMASMLGGVEDKTVVPARGQVVVVRNEPGVMVGGSSFGPKKSDMTYMMTRAAGGGTVLGGCYEIGNWDPQPDLAAAAGIMKRCVDLYPRLTNGKGIEALSVIRHGVGFRPLRPQGPRVETEYIGGIPVVHNYGHGGGGYQNSYATADMAVKLIKEALSGRAKL